MVIARILNMLIWILCLILTHYPGLGFVSIDANTAQENQTFLKPHRSADNIIIDLEPLNKSVHDYTVPSSYNYISAKYPLSSHTTITTNTPVYNYDHSINSKNKMTLPKSNSKMVNSTITITTTTNNNNNKNKNITVYNTNNNSINNAETETSSNVSNNETRKMTTAISRKTRAHNTSTHKMATHDSTIHQKPCTTGSSILVAREDVPIGTVLMEIPAVQGETWVLKNLAVPTRYLELESTNESARVVFKKTPDIEEIPLNGRRKSQRKAITFYMHCLYQGWTYKYRHQLLIDDVNEHPPVFDTTRSYNVSINEASPVGARVLSLRHLAWDPDVTGRVVGYSMTPYIMDPKRDGMGTFGISNKGDYILLLKPLDFDVMKTRGVAEYFVNITAKDNGDPSPKTSNVIFRIDVADADDQGPAFRYPNCPRVSHNRCRLPRFQAITKCGYEGPLQLYPGPIQAYDPDSFNNTVFYSIEKVDPAWYRSVLEMGNRSGQVTLMTSSCSSGIQKILVKIKATEDSVFQHSVTATLQLDILDESAFSNHVWQFPPFLRLDPSSSGSRTVQMDGTDDDVHDKVNVNGGGGDTKRNDDGDIGDDGLREENEDRKSKYTSLPVIFFILSLLGFVATGGGLAFAGIQFSRRRKNKAEAGGGCSRKNSGDNTHQFCGCGKTNASETSSAITAFAACPLTVNASGSFVNKAAAFGPDTLKRVLEVGEKGQEPPIIEPTCVNDNSNDIFREERDQIARNHQSRNDTQTNMVEERVKEDTAREGGFQRDQTKDSKTEQQREQFSQTKQHQDIFQQQEEHQPPPAPRSPPPLHSSISPFPFSANLFIQRRNHFQQQQQQQQGEDENHVQRGQRIASSPPLPPPPPPRSREPRFEPPLPPPPPLTSDASLNNNQNRYWQQQRQQKQQHEINDENNQSNPDQQRPHHHNPQQLETKTRDHWNFLEDSEDQEEFSVNPLNPGPWVTSTSFLAGSPGTTSITSDESMRSHPPNNRRGSLMMSFRENRSSNEDSGKEQRLHARPPIKANAADTIVANDDFGMDKSLHNNRSSHKASLRENNITTNGTLQNASPQIRRPSLTTSFRDNFLSSEDSASDYLPHNQRPILRLSSFSFNEKPNQRPSSTSYFKEDTERAASSIDISQSPHNPMEALRTSFRQNNIVNDDDIMGNPRTPSSNFKDRLNQLVPQCLRVNNVQPPLSLFSSQVSHSHSNQKVRFDVI